MHCLTPDEGIPLAPGAAPPITSLLVKPVSAVCNLNCTYCFYANRPGDPYRSSPSRRMTLEILDKLVDGYLFHSYPNGIFAFQGGEPMLAGRPFYDRLIEYQNRYRRDGQAVSNIMQTNGVLIDEGWSQWFREHRWLVGVSLDGPEELHDRYRADMQGHGAWKRVVRGVEAMKRHGVEFNVLCVLSQANVGRPENLYRFFRSLGVDHIQYIPLSDYDPVTAEQYGRFMCATFDLWWPERRKVRIRCFDNIAEAVAGQKPSNCAMRETCDSYVVVEYNGDVYPCDFFVEKDWRLGNVAVDSWAEIARSRLRYAFAVRKAGTHPACQTCQFQAMCRGGCPRNRRGDGLDCFCAAFQMIFAKAAGPISREIAAMRQSRLSESRPRNIPTAPRPEPASCYS